MPEISAEQWIDQGLDALDRGDLAGAHRAAAQALAARPQYGEALHLLGVVQLTNNDIEGAIEHLRRAVAAEPNESEFHNNLGVAYRAQSNMAEATACFARAVGLDPANAMAQLNWSMALQGRGEHVEAEQACRRALDADPALAAAWCQLGETLAHQSKIGEALIAWQKALDLDPNLGVAHLNMGFALSTSGRADEAVATLERAAAAGPRDPRPQWLLGHLLQTRHRFDDAIGRFQRAVQLDPQCAQAWEGLAQCLSARDRLEEALAAGRKAVALAPESAGAYYAMGVALEHAGQKSQAQTCYRTAAKLHPSMRRLLYDVAALSEDPAAAPTASPREFVLELFGEYAETFEKHLVDRLKYRTPQHLVHAVREVLAMSATLSATMDILDLGCGTGLAGQLFRPLARSMVGVDLVPQMVVKSRERGVYEEVVQSDVAAFLTSTERTFDLIVSADVFVYIGDLGEVFAGATKALRPGGRFAFSLEAHDDPGFRLRASRRYTHNIAYARELAAANGLSELYAERVVLRTENDRDVAGWIVVLAKPESPALPSGTHRN